MAERFYEQLLLFHPRQILQDVQELINVVVSLFLDSYPISNFVSLLFLAHTLHSCALL